MPKRTDINKVLVLGSGPVVIGQGPECECAGLQACRALRDEGLEIIVVNSSPATMMADRQLVNKVFIEPLTAESLSRIIDIEHPDALLPAPGGQAALNLVALLSREGALKRAGVKVLGADEDIIARAEDRKIFRKLMQSTGIRVPRGSTAASLEEGMQAIREIGFPAVLEPAYSASGAGSGTAYNMEEFVQMFAFALKASPISQVLIEESVAGWKEVEFEVVRDSAGGCAVIAAMENIDPMGVHSGDSAVVVPPQTLAADMIDSMNASAAAAAGAIGVVGEANIRFACDPESRDIVAISASVGATRDTTLAGRATGMQIAKIATKLAVGYTLDELADELAFSEAECCTVKLPRFVFDRFPGADPALGTSMKSMGEAVAIGGNFKEALQKAIRSLEIGRYGLGADAQDVEQSDPDAVREMIARPNPERLFCIRRAIEGDMSDSEISDLSHIDEWFIRNIRELVSFEKQFQGKSLVGVSADVLEEAKRLGYSDAQLAVLLETDEDQVRVRRRVLGITSKFRRIGAGEHAAYYATYGPGESVDADPGDKKAVIPGGGPDRIGQGIEFDYCRAQAERAIAREGYRSININCNPHAVSLDLADVVYIAPLTREDVLDILEREKPMGVMPYFGGETPINLSRWIAKAGINILGTSPKNVERAKDWAQYDVMIRQLKLRETAYAVARSLREALEDAGRIGYPLLAGRRRILGGRAVEIFYDEASLAEFLSIEKVTPENPALMEGFLEDAIEVGVDAVSDAKSTLICGVMEHIEQAGIHAGDSACSLPPYSLSPEIVNEIRRQVHLIAEEIEILGFINIQFAVKNNDIYVLNINPYASRTVPFVSKATGVEWAEVAARAILGKSFEEQGITGEVNPRHISVKEAVFPFIRFPGVDVVLGPEMKSTGGVMGIDTSFGQAYIKAQIAAGQDLPQKGTAFVSIADADKAAAPEIGKKLRELGFKIVATKGTAKVLREAGVEADTVSKIGEGRPDATDLIKNEQIDLIINTPSGKRPRLHEVNIRSAVVARGIPIITTIAGARATLLGMETARTSGPTVMSLEEYTGDLQR